MTRSATQKRRIHTEVPEAAVLTASAEVGIANTSSSEKQPRLGTSAPETGTGAYRAVFACASLSQERPARKG